MRWVWGVPGVLTDRQVEAAVRDMGIEGIENTYPLAPLQQGLLFHQLAAEHPGVNLVQVVCRLHEDLDVPAFSRGWERVVARHPSYGEQSLLKGSPDRGEMRRQSFARRRQQRSKLAVEQRPGDKTP